MHMTAISKDGGGYTTDLINRFRAEIKKDEIFTNTYTNLRLIRDIDYIYVEGRVLKEDVQREANK